LSPRANEVSRGVSHARFLDFGEDAFVWLRHRRNERNDSNHQVRRHPTRQGAFTGFGNTKVGLRARRRDPEMFLTPTEVLAESEVVRLTLRGRPVWGQSSPGSSPSNPAKNLPSSSTSSLSRCSAGCSPDSSPGDCPGSLRKNRLSCCPSSFPRSLPSSRASCPPSCCPNCRPSS
jgi:hypothetical protein